MRVLIVTPWFPWPENPIRGIWTIDHARAVAMAGHEPVLLAFSPRKRARGPYELSDQVEQGIRTFRITYPPPKLPGLGLLPARRGTLEALARLRDEGVVPEIVHAHTFLAASAALSAQRRTGAPLLINEHFTRVTEWELSRAERALARLAYSRAQLVCTTAEAMVANVRRLGAKRTRHTLNVMNSEQFSPNSSRPRDRERITAIAAGSLNEKKGHRYLLEALAIARRSEPRLRLDLAGDGELRGELERQAESLGIADVVEFHGYLPLDELAELMRGADLHMLPSLRENQPLVVAEAMATGIPTVASDVGSVAEMLGGEAGVVVPKQDSEALAQAILEVCATLDHYDPQALAARARQRYAFEAVGRQWSEIYEQLRREAR